MRGVPFQIPIDPNRKIVGLLAGDAPGRVDDSPYFPRLPLGIRIDIDLISE